MKQIHPIVVDAPSVEFCKALTTKEHSVAQIAETKELKITLVHNYANGR